MKNTHFIPLFFLFLYGCASGANSHIETAKFELDLGNYNAAIDEASQALADSPNNAEAARLLASAYFGRSGIDFLDLAQAIVDLGTDAQSNFKVIADALPETADMDDVRSAIETVATIDGVDDTTINNETLADAVFDMSMMQIIEHFALGVYGSDYFATLDVPQILETESDTALADLIAFDNHLIASGVAADKDFISEIRQTFCILEPVSAGDGFTLAEYQALVACQLSDDPDSFDTTALTADIANCAALTPSTQTDDIQACYAVDTTL